VNNRGWRLHCFTRCFGNQTLGINMVKLTEVFGLQESIIKLTKQLTDWLTKWLTKRLSDIEPDGEDCVIGRATACPLAFTVATVFGWRC
jgi:hypothetical protein